MELTGIRTQLTGGVGYRGIRTQLTGGVGYQGIRTQLTGRFPYKIDGWILILRFRNKILPVDGHVEADRVHVSWKAVRPVG